MRRIARTLVLVEAALWLTLAHLAVHAIAFRRLARFVGRPGVVSADPGDDGRRLLARRIGAVVERVAARHPLKPLCLAQTIAAKRMLLGRGIESTLYLGLRRRGSAPTGAPLRPALDIAPHAWLSAGGLAVLGDNADGHAVVAHIT